MTGNYYDPHGGKKEGHNQRPFNNPTAATMSLFIHHFINQYVDPATLVRESEDIHPETFVVSRAFNSEYLESKTKELTRFIFKHFVVLDKEDDPNV